jgi:beta-lactamase class A
MVNRRQLVAAAALGVLPAAAQAGTLEERLKPLIEAHKGKVAVVVKHLVSGEGFAFRADEPMPTASLIKFPVMVETYRQAEAGKVDLERMLTLRSEERVPGSGILTQLSPGLSLCLRDAVRLMIALSDNTATNLVLDQIGIGSTAETMEKLGCPNTKIHAKVFRRDTSVFPERSKQFGLGSTTAAEMVRLLEALHKKELASAKSCDAMIAHMKACDDPFKFPLYLPPGVGLAHKTGSVDDAKTAAGIIYGKQGPVALCVLTSENQDRRWVADNAGNRLCAEVAREVLEHFNPDAKALGR